MEIDRRAFFAGLGGVAAVAAMADEAKAEALEHHMMLQLNVANQAARAAEVSDGGRSGGADRNAAPLAAALVICSSPAPAT